MIMIRMTRSTRTRTRTTTTGTFLSCSCSCSWALILPAIIIALPSLSSNKYRSNSQSLLFVQASPYIISDDRVRSLDTTPALGRGYSIMTNGFLSTCLMVNETTVPSYNYDFSFNDLTHSKDIEAELAGSLSKTFAYSQIKKEFTKKISAFSATQTKNSAAKPYFVVSTMKIDRYYSSVREEASPLSPDAAELLERQDYVGFFKSCGPNYVRSIRRAQEVTAIFYFRSASRSTAQEFAEGLQVTNVVKAPTTLTTLDTVGLSPVVQSADFTSVREPISKSADTSTMKTSLSSRTSTTTLSTTKTTTNYFEAKEAYRSTPRTYDVAPVVMRSRVPYTSPSPTPTIQPTKTEHASKSKYSSITQSLEIKIIAHGLGLNKGGSTTLVATSLEEYDDVMKFAFQSMTMSNSNNEDDNHKHIGMVYGIEILPWVDNPAFQVASRLHRENIVLPLPRSMIPKAFPKSLPSGSPTAAPTTASSGISTTNLGCRDTSKQIDKYGYCCEAGALYDPSTGTYNSTDASTRVCRPLQAIDKTILKDNMSNNGEFIVRMDAALRNRLNQLFALEQCISAVNSYSERYDPFILKSKGNVRYDALIESNFTLAELRLALDPFGDYSLVQHLTKELDEYVDMYYSPCIASLFGTNVGSTSDVEPKYFMASAWHSHEECTKLTCLADNMRWDRANGGCIPSLITGSTAPGYNQGDSMCSYDNSNNEEAQVCKYNTTVLSEYHDSVTECWDSSLPPRSVDYIMEYFCTPEITGDKVDSIREQEIKDHASSCTPPDSATV